MREDIKDRWVARLRSGQDKQGTGALHRWGKKCCLGVLCEIAVEDGIIGSRTWHPGDGTNNVIYGRDLDTPISRGMTIPKSDQVLPDAVRDWAGVRTSTGYLRPRDALWPRGRPQDLASANDGYCMDFNQIADLIEQNWKAL